MFKHEMAPSCKYDITCNRKKCQFQHKQLQKTNKPIPIKCSYCGEEMISNADMKKHYEKHHQIKYENCEDVFTSEKEHELHLKSDHAIKDSKKTYPCEKCNFVFKSIEKFDIHLSGLQHNRVEKHDDSYSEYEDDSDDEEYVDSCSFCKTVLRSYEETDDHQSNYIRCEKCNVCFHNEFQCDDHVKCDIF